MCWFLFHFGRNWVLETWPGSQPPALTSDRNRRNSPPFHWQSRDGVPGCDLKGGLQSTALGFWLGRLRLVRWGKESQSDPTGFELGRTVRCKGPIEVGDAAQPGLAPVCFLRARCQKWANIRLHLIKNKRKQSASYLHCGAKVSRVVFGSRRFESHSLMTQPKKYSKLAWSIKACF